MKQTRAIGLILFLLLTFPAGGCWDKIEVKELGIVMGIGLDWLGGGRPVQLVLQTVKPTNGQNGENKSTGGGGHYETFIIRGETVYDAFDQMQRISYKQIILPHSKLIVIGRGFAEHGMADLSDYLMREREIRPTSWVVIADTSAKEVLEEDLGAGPIPAAGLVSMVEKLKNTSMAHPTNLIQFYMLMQSDAGVTLAPLIRKEGSRINFESTAVFRQDRMIGTLNVNETRGLLWLEDKLVKGNATLPYRKGESGLQKNVTVEINKGDTRITPRFRAPREISMKIECSGVAQIREAEMDSTLFKPETIEDLETAVEELLKKRIQHTIDVAQKELQADFIGFGDTFHNAYPGEWKSLKDEWSEVFPTVKTEIKMDIDIARLGITKNPTEF